MSKQTLQTTHAINQYFKNNKNIYKNCITVYQESITKQQFFVTIVTKKSFTKIVVKIKINKKQRLQMTSSSIIYATFCYGVKPLQKMK